MPYLVDFFIDHKLDGFAKYELFAILGEHFNKYLSSFLAISDIPITKQAEILTFLERHSPDIKACLDCLIIEGPPRGQSDQK